MRAVYIRVSRAEQTAKNQLRDILPMLGTEKYVLFTDTQSAWSDVKRRDGFEDLKVGIKGGKYTDLYVWDFDRLYRNRSRFKTFLVYLKHYRVRLHSVRQGWLEDLHKIPEPWNDIVHGLMIDIYGHIAQEESDKKSERVKLAVRRGDGGTVSYRGNKWGRKALPNSVVKEILVRHGEGWSMRKISRSVFYYDKNRNRRGVSLGAVHKIVSQN